MPLRAKLLPQQAQRASIVTRAIRPEFFRPIEGDEPEDVLFQSIFGLRSIELNRPKKYNSLNGSMARKIMSRLLEWEKSDMANVIVIKGAGDKAFCAGGDVAQLVKWNKEEPDGWKKSVEYFALEYRLDHLIATYQKPYVAFMDGITMGGGVGLSVHAPFRIATERTQFAMPETTIGFFPDVGASYFLPRLPGYTGTYLALTSERLNGADAFYSGIATHYLHSTSLPELEKRLGELRFRDSDLLHERLRHVNATIEEFNTGLPHNQPPLLAGYLRKAIDRCFDKQHINDIIRSLEAEAVEGAAQSTSAGQKIKDWAEKTMETLHARSPTSVHVTLKQMLVGSEWDITQTFQREYQMAAKFMRNSDFNEGVTARLIEKRVPNWQPASLADIPPTVDIAKKFLEKDRELAPLDINGDIQPLPDSMTAFGLPTELDVKRLIRLQERINDREIYTHFITETRGKQGVKQVLSDIIARKTLVDGEGNRKWKGLDD